MATQQAPPRLSSQAFWLIVARVVGFVFLLALPIVMVRVFDKEQFGIYKQVFIVVGTVTALTSFSFAISAFYFLPRLPEKQGVVVFNIVLYHAASGLLAFAVFAFWPGILKLILGDAGLEHYALILGAVIATWEFSSFLETVATAKADVAWSTAFIIGAQISKTVLLLFVAGVFRTVDAVLYGALAQGVLQSLILLVYLEKRFPGYWRRFDREIAREQFRYAAPFGVYGLLYSVQTDLHNYLVSHRFTAAEFAVYAVGTTQIPLVGILRDSLNAVLLPRASKLQQENRREEILDLTMRAWAKLSAALLPLCALLLVLGRDFITVLYTSRYLASWPIFALNLVLLLYAIFLTDAVIRAYTESRFFFLNLRIVTVAIQVPVSILAMNVFGMIGALIGVLVVTTIERVVSLVVVMKLLGFAYRDLAKLSRMVGFAAASTVAALATWAVRLSLPPLSAKLALVSCSLVFGAVYVAAVLSMKLLDSEERELANRYSMKFLKVRLLN
jgi:O-antigen/teichoic acid export membrane protein